MGWLYQTEKLRDQTPCEYLRKLFTREDASAKITVVDAAAVGGVVYGRHRA